MVKFVRITSLFTLMNHGQNSKIESFPQCENFTGYLRFMRKIRGVPRTMEDTMSEDTVVQI